MTKHISSEVPRTLGEIHADCKYGYYFNLLNERLYRRMNGLCSFISLTSAVIVVASLFSSSTLVSTVAAIVVVACVVGVDATNKYAAHQQAKKQFLVLGSQVWNMAQQDAETALARVQADGPTGFSVIAPIAYRDAVISYGANDYAPVLTRWQRLIALAV